MQRFSTEQVNVPSIKTSVPLSWLRERKSVFGRNGQTNVGSERKANFADVEVRVMIDLYQQHRSKLTGKFSNILIQRQKTTLWQENPAASVSGKRR